MSFLGVAFFNNIIIYSLLWFRFQVSYIQYLQYSSCKQKLQMFPYNMIENKSHINAINSSDVSKLCEKQKNMKLLMR